MVGFLKTFTQNSTTISLTSRRQPDPPGDLTPQLCLCTQLVIALRRWRFTAEDTPAPAPCSNGSLCLSLKLQLYGQQVAALPLAVHCRRYRLLPALMTLYACPADRYRIAQECRIRFHYPFGEILVSGQDFPEFPVILTSVDSLVCCCS